MVGRDVPDVPPESPDVFPVDDLGIVKGVQKLLGMKPPALKPQTLARLAEGWRPYRSIAAWYLWRLLELPSVESSGELARLPVKRRK